MAPEHRDAMLEKERQRLPVGFVAQAEDIVESYLYLIKCEAARLPALFLSQKLTAGHHARPVRDRRDDPVRVIPLFRSGRSLTVSNAGSALSVDGGAGLV